MFSRNNNLLTKINPSFPTSPDVNMDVISKFMDQNNSPNIIAEHEKLFTSEFMSYYTTNRDSARLIPLAVDSYNYNHILNVSDSANIWYIDIMVPLLPDTWADFLLYRILHHSVNVVKHILTYPIAKFAFIDIIRQLVNDGNAEILKLLHQHGAEYNIREMLFSAIALEQYDTAEFLIQITPNAKEEFQELTSLIIRTLV